MAMNNSATTSQGQQMVMGSQNSDSGLRNRRWMRDGQRQLDRALDKDWEKNRDWSSQVDVENKIASKTPTQQPVSRTRRNRNRAVQWKTNKKISEDASRIDPSKYKSVATSELKDEPLYNIVNGSRPNKRLYSVNFDFSSFPLLCDMTYRELRLSNPRIKREMPFCSFLHSMTSCLNAWIIQTVKKINSEDRFSEERDPAELIPLEMLIPQPIAEYLSLVNTIVTSSGDTVRVNFPDAGLPQLSLPEDGDKPEVPPGSFGDVTSQNHNAYECYVSPLITRRFLEASRDNNPNYHPLPPERVTAGTTPTRNLLGYYPVEKVPPEGVAILSGYEFPETDDMTGRLQLVPSLMLEVSNSLFRCQRDVKMTKFHDIVRKPVQTGLVFAKVTSAPQINVSTLFNISSNLHGPMAFGNVTASQAALFAYRRERTSSAKGLCYVAANNAVPAGWGATINNNFNMAAPFHAYTGVDGPQFRSDQHQAFPPDTERATLIGDWLKNFRLSQR
ncbi:hypothetical protein [Wuhan insect virus 22]|uniref:hypothetical protein n=1 Tax=Wuhan insect virus 22 TaxID=1923726 RepID=UPI0009094D8B|nr:hypothetical protein [Wuhan insect virus 22]APG78161.1 hypothetical protein [Wuhan insect virus 22]APG78287.1 hypothetical protein [Wuhan insect virus 22]APG78337.1 hypothetical protein [Wuhan insect virus 22]